MAGQPSDKPSDHKTYSSGSIGQQLVGLHFNPDKNPAVTRAKALSAALIDELLEVKVLSGVHQNLVNAAIQTLITAQMWVVKCITWRQDEPANKA